MLTSTYQVCFDPWPTMVEGLPHSCVVTPKDPLSNNGAFLFQFL
jgi:hypothetical protein